jgi:hypothetical protein
MRMNMELRISFIPMRLNMELGGAEDFLYPYAAEHGASWS